MTWVMLSLMYSFGVQSAKIAAALPPPSLPTQSTVVPLRSGSAKSADVRFSLSISGINWSWDTLALFMLPGERRRFRISAADLDGSFDWSATGGELNGAAPRERTYIAPATPGLYQVHISRGRCSKRVNVFVLVPFRHQESLNGYRIGRYPKTPHYARLGLPRGFIEVNSATLNAWLSPHFRLREFVCHEPSDFPKYVVLRESLIRKLEFLIAFLQRKGVRCPGLHVISGYRTPCFNSAQGNAQNSAHTYGAAADIYIDADNDGVMDDLNRDGKRDIQDAIFLYNMCELLEKQYPEFVGGDGYYPGSGPHGPFVHTDTRGQISRWHG